MFFSEYDYRKARILTVRRDSKSPPYVYRVEYDKRDMNLCEFFGHVCTSVRLSRPTLAEKRETLCCGIDW
jgi:hypothetical protein